MANVSVRHPAPAQFDLSSDPMEAIEFELRLDLEDASSAGFDVQVAEAAEACGGSLLFEMPPAPLPQDDANEAFLRISAVRFPSRTGDRLVFAGLTPDGGIRVLRRADVGERFYGFARAYLGILDRLHHDGVTAGHA